MARTTYGPCINECGREAKYKARQECNACYLKGLAERNPDYKASRLAAVKAYQKKTLYGITQTEYEAQYAKQAGLCALCGNGCSSGMRLAVDHDHATGKVRGLLCMNCNQGLGKFKDDIRLMARAIAYLQGGGVW